MTRRRIAAVWYPGDVTASRARSLGGVGPYQWAVYAHGRRLRVFHLKKDAVKFAKKESAKLRKHSR